jgi:predicted metal-dependent phosphoesterase TrpH
MIRMDFHNHTRYSPDSMTEPRALAEKARRLGIVPAITDHDTICAHAELRRIGAIFIPGQEASTDAGDLIGLYLSEQLPRKGDFLETIDRIRQQGGLAYLPHMFDVTRAGVGIPELASKADIIEIFNARSVRKDFNRKAEEFARSHQMPGAAGSDSHFLFEFGTTYTELPDFEISDPKALMKALPKARIVGKPAPIYVKGTTTAVKLWKKLTRKR